MKSTTVSETIASPHDLELEKQILAQCITFPEAFPLYSSHGLKPEHFYRTVHQWMYRAITDLTERGLTPDYMAVASELRERGQLEEVGPAYLGTMSNDAMRPRAENVAHFAGKLRGLETARKVIKLAEVTRAQLRSDPSLVTGEFFNEHLTALDTIRAEVGSDSDFLDVDQQLAAHDQYIAEDDQRRVSFALGEAIDEATSGGMRGGEVAGLLARPGVGKTIAMCNIAYQLGQRNPDLGHLFFSLEMPAPQIIERMRRMVYGMSKQDIRAAIQLGQLDPEPYKKIFRNLIIIDRPGLSVGEIGNRIRHAEVYRFKEGQIGLVSIDHLGLLGGGNGLGTYDRVSTHAREIKEVAKRHRVPVFLAVQVSREAGGDGSKELNLGAARDSGVIEEVCDYMIGMRNKSLNTKLSPADREVIKDQRHVKLIKNRHGEALQTETELYFNMRSLDLADKRIVVI